MKNSRRFMTLLAALTCACATQAATNIWTGSGNASLDGNWSLGHAPTASEDVLLDATSIANMTWDADATNTVASWTQAAGYVGTVTFTTVYGSSGFTNFTITGDALIDGGSWTHQDNSTTEAKRLKVTIDGSLNVGSNGTIKADGLGYDNNSGTGAGKRYAGTNDGGGGGHGGNGRACGLAVWGYAYGDCEKPVNIGSGGGSGYGSGASGGGAIHLSVGGDIVVNGLITTKGGPRGTSGAGGAGGSIWLQLDGGSISGTGTLQAPGTIDGGGTTAGGSGGRVAVTGYGSRSGFTGLMQAYGGRDGGSAGTVYRANAAGTERELVIDNNAQYTYAVTPFGKDMSEFANLTALVITNRGRFAVESGKTLTLGGVSISGMTPSARGELVYRGGTVDFLTPSSDYVIPEHMNLCVDTNLTLNSLTITTNTALVHTENMWLQEFRVDLTLLKSSGTALDLQPGGKIDVYSYGYTVGTGPGAGLRYGNNVGGGGAHGGDGAWSGLAAGGKAYGSAAAPVTIGSSGSAGSGGGAKGGGAIKIFSHGDIVLNGPITANAGLKGTGGGGGAGGSIWLDLQGGTISGNGDITANGTVGVSNGGGGGGRVALTGYSSIAGYTGKVQAYGGSGSHHGAAGTIYREAWGGGVKELVVDNNGLYSSVITPSWATGVLPQGLTSLVIANRGRFGIEPGQDLTLGAGLLSGNSASTGELVYRGGTVDFLAETSDYTVSTNVMLCIDTNLVLNSLIIPSNAVMTHTQNRETQRFTAVVELLKSSGTALDVQVGGKIDVSGLGYLPEYGPGMGERGTSFDCGGGGHGGQGGSYGSAAGGVAYDLMFAPRDCGSGGRSGMGSGSAGGGSVNIVSHGDVRVDGSILARGGPAGTHGSGGAGGSIWLDLKGGAIEGGGLITADGSPLSSRGGGAGGRIALTGYGTLGFTGTVQATSGKGETYGAGGTRYLEAVTSADSKGTVTLDFGNLATTSYVPLPVLTNGVVDNVTAATFDLVNGARLLVQTNVMAHALTMASGTELELNGQTLTLRYLTVDSVRFGASSYTADDSPLFYDRLGGGRIDVIGSGLGTTILVR